MNLLINARDAMPSGAAITIRTLVDGGHCVHLQVSDAAVGMDPNTLQHAFDPFFTTKPRGKGTGLGLSTEHAVVAELGGRVDVAFEVGLGTTFSVIVSALAVIAVVVRRMRQRPSPIGIHRQHVWISES